MKVNKKINLYQLDQELNGQGLTSTFNANKEIVEVNLGVGNNATEAELKSAINAHIAIDEDAAKAAAKAAAQAKLAALGLTVEDLQALGL